MLKYGTSPTPARRLKDDLFGQVARITQALSSPRRLELLDVLCQGPRTVEELAQQTAGTLPNTSQHLKALKAARLVASTKDGLYVRYRVADPEVARFHLALRRLAERRLTEIDAILADFMRSRANARVTGAAGGEAWEEVDQRELMRRARGGEVTVLDVRDASEYAAGHLPGARSIPLAELSARMGELPPDRAVVACCRGPWCVLALEAVEALRAAGLTAWRLDSGPVEWAEQGVCLERAA